MENSKIKRALLIILDGVGIGPIGDNNGWTLADTPNIDLLLKDYPSAAIEASGENVGLPKYQMGNSEVGHMIIGSGKIFKQDLVIINEAIEDSSFFSNEAILNAIFSAKENNSSLHLLGLASPGGVHSHINHLLSILKICKSYGISPKLHLFTDGRDSDPKSSIEILDNLDKSLKEYGGEIYTISGRYYAMDRDQRWSRTELAWDAIVNNKGETRKDYRDAINSSYAKGITDEFILPTSLNCAKPLQKNDSLLFFNFRNDRTRQIARALNVERFDNFKRTNNNIAYSITTMTEYDPYLSCPVAFRTKSPSVTLGSVISDLGLKQFHCAETEKYPHVTYFINGGREEPYPGEKRVLIPSPNVATYDLQPEMSVKEVAEEVIRAIKDTEYKFIVVNFANGDMVGHTAIKEAIILAMSELDAALGEVVCEAIGANVSTIITADHGNVDEINNPKTGKPNTQHSLNPVPFIVIDNNREWQIINDKNAGLSNIAPTLLTLMGIEKPKEMTSKTLIKEN
ncbi:MAG: 2,3-bisphosphoglycerate-independent phosphoglycerate mutase [Gammaproteobacteria bacterium]|jgi:2,3-bisphosphoglycerate-independent phosphoglycerate mutase|nr:2,3-bisphosphoglycerate-independent phosphoglycerate mutase [Gammaproteobacteria bacterium]MBT7522917.1 2,3-bisphosphoglycerate-independent phosphoglycerate mutase [Gammaproteobacteria bacterium]